MERFLDVYAGLIQGLRPANERCRYNVTPSLIGWAQTVYMSQCLNNLLIQSNHRRNYRLFPNSMSPISGRFLVITAINRNGQNLIGHKPKRPQTETATDRNGHKLERPQTELATDRKGHRPKRPQTERTQNINSICVETWIRVQLFFCQISIRFCQLYSCVYVYSKVSVLHYGALPFVSWLDLLIIWCNIYFTEPSDWPCPRRMRSLYVSNSKYRDFVVFTKMISCNLNMDKEPHVKCGMKLQNFFQTWTVA